MNALTKDQIKDRLLKRAAKQWGYSDVELENVFDPIVNLLFDVCAKELEKISHEIFSSRRRITERLVDILTPTASAKATPARAIMRAYPIENETVLKDHHQFYFQRKETNPYNPVESLVKNYYFGPTKAVKLTRNKLRYVILPNGVQEVVKEQFRPFVAQADFAQPLPHGTVWLGLKHEGDGMLKDLMFYFYLKNIHQRDLFFHFLPKADWFINGRKLTVSRGYNDENDFGPEYGDLVREDFYHIENTQQHVNDFYRKHFITVKDSLNLTDTEPEFPAGLQPVLPEETAKQLAAEQLIWIKIEFPSVVGKDILSEIFCNTNCFPVINKKMNEVQGTIKNMLNIYPLRLDDEFFLELHSVSDDKNREFDIVKNDDDRADSDYVHLRFGGIARFDERNATEEITYLIDLIRDEAAAFSRLGHDFTDQNLKEINQVISRFRNKMSQEGIRNISNPYLIFNSAQPEKKGILFSKYWTTNGEAANKITTFSRAVPHKGSDFERDTILFLSSTHGGKNELSNSQKIYAYRENLVSNQRVVTRQDIIILCKNHFGEAIAKVEVKNGIQTSLDSNVGYTPTIDIHLHRTDPLRYSDEEWHFLSEDLKLILESRAIDIVPFRLLYK